MDLFDFNGNAEAAKPLAERMRANNLNDFIGQSHIVSPGSLLRRAIAPRNIFRQAGQLHILGPARHG